MAEGMALFWGASSTDPHTASVGRECQALRSTLLVVSSVQEIGAGFHLVDVHVGKRRRQWRALLSLTQGALGKALRITFRQVQKYERGANRLGASKLYEAAQILTYP